MTWAQLAGAAYLLYSAYRMWRSAGVPAKALIKPAGRAFRQGFLVNLFNPKSVLFAAAAVILGALGVRILLASPEHLEGSEVSSRRHT